MSKVGHDFINADQPWPGLAAFSEADKDFFHGRAQATQDLVRLVNTSHASVLFGQSGLGKSSLIQAGLFPHLRPDDFLPVYVRLDHSVDAPPLFEQILLALEQESRKSRVDFPQRIANDSLWAYFHRRNADFWGDGIQLLTPVVILDQFEEIFTVGRQSPALQRKVEIFIDDLAGLVENRPPQNIRQQIEADPAISREYDFTRANFRLLISMREDFLPELEELMPQIPTLRLNRMRLLPMNGSEALQVVNQGGGHLVAPDVGDKIIRFVAADKKERALQELVVEPSLLSLVCSELNRRRQSNGLTQITAGLLTGARDEILHDFYTRSLDGLPPSVYEFIEDHLLSESGYRNSFVLEDAYKLPNITQKVIDTLVDRRLIRLDERYGVLRVELTHDVLTPVAKESRNKRLMEKQRRRQRFLYLCFCFMSVALIGVSVLAFYAFSESSRAELAENRALKEKNNAVAAEEKALNEKNKAVLAESLALEERDKANKAKKDAIENKLIAEREKVKAEIALIETEKQKEIAKTALEKAHNLRIQLNSVLSKNLDKEVIEKYKIEETSIENYPDLILLINNTESMDDKEKQYWFDIMPAMTDSQVDRLYDILEIERVKLGELENKYQKEINDLNKKHVNEWFQFQIKNYKKSNNTDEKIELIKSASYLYENNEDDDVDGNILSIESLLGIIFESDDIQVDLLYKSLARNYIKINNINKAYEYFIKAIGEMDKKFLSGKIEKEIFEKRMPGTCLSTSWYALLLNKYDFAIKYAEKGLKVAPEYLALETNLAHGLLFANQEEKALEIYTRNIGRKVNKDQTWQQVVLEDFAALREKGLSHPRMTEIIEMLTASKVTQSKGN